MQNCKKEMEANKDQNLKQIKTPEANKDWKLLSAIMENPLT